MNPVNVGVGKPCVRCGARAAMIAKGEHKRAGHFCLECRRRLSKAALR